MNWLEQLRQVQENLRLMAMESDSMSASFYATGNKHMSDFMTNQAATMACLDECIFMAISTKLDQEFGVDAISRQDPRPVLEVVKGGRN